MQRQDQEYPGERVMAGEGLKNGCLAFEPDASKGMICVSGHGLDTGTDAGLDFVDQSGFPGGKALENASGGVIGLQTAASALLSAIGNTDFVLTVFMRASADADGRPNGFVGENNNNGIDFGVNGDPFPTGINCEMPGGDGMYQPAVNSSPDTPFTADTCHMLAMWNTVSDSMLRMSVDGGTAYSVENTSGIGDADLTNFIKFAFSNTSGAIQFGAANFWQAGFGADIAAVIAALPALYAQKTRYSQFTARANNLLDICTAALEPTADLKMTDRTAHGLTTNSDEQLTFEDESDFPGGKALQLEATPVEPLIPDGETVSGDLDNVTHPGITTTTANSLAIMIGFSLGHDSEVGGFPSGWNSDYDTNEGGTEPRGLIATSKTIVSPGATGAVSAPTTSGSNFAWMMALKPQSTTVDFRSCKRTSGALPSQVNTTMVASDGIADDDILIAMLHTWFLGDVTPPVGWTEYNPDDPFMNPTGIYGDFSSGDYTRFYWKRASSEGSSWTWTHADARVVGFVAAYSGAVTSGDPNDVTPTFNVFPAIHSDPVYVYSDLSSTASALIANIGATPFLIWHWDKVSDDCDDNPYSYIGEHNNNGVDFSGVAGWTDPPFPGKIYAEMPGADGNYDLLAQSDLVEPPEFPYLPNVANMQACWYLSDTLYTSLNAAAPYSVVNTFGIGDEDLTNYIRISFSQMTRGTQRQGPWYLLQGTEEQIAAVVAQLIDMKFLRTAFADFTSSGEDGGTVKAIINSSLRLWPHVGI